MLGKELQRRIWVIVVSIGLVLMVMLENRDKVLYILRKLLGSGLVEVSMLDTFKVVLELTITMGIIVTIPVIQLQVYLYVCQGLFKEEQQQIKKHLVVNILFYIIGILTFKTMFINIREMLYLFKNQGLEEVENLESILVNYQVVIRVLLGLLVLCQIPLIIQIGLDLKILASGSLLKNRRINILIMTVLLMIINGAEIWTNIVIVLVFILIYEGQWFKERLKDLKL